jgi:hypothetical protein
MENTAARKYAIIEKVMQLNEKELTALEDSLLKESKTPVSNNEPAKEPKKDAKPEDDRDEMYNLKKIETMGRKW